MTSTEQRGIWLMNLEAEIRACLIQPILSSSSKDLPTPVECKYFMYVQLHIENVLMRRDLRIDVVRLSRQPPAERWCSFRESLWSHSSLLRVLQQNTMDWLAYLLNFISHSSGGWEILRKSRSRHWQIHCLVKTCSGPIASHLHITASHGGRGEGARCLYKGASSPLMRAPSRANHFSKPQAPKATTLEVRISNI